MRRYSMVIVLCLVLCFVLTGCDTMEVLRKGLTNLRQGIERFEVEIDGGFGVGAKCPLIPAKEPIVEPEVIVEDETAAEVEI